MLFHEWRKLMKAEHVNRRRILNFQPFQLIGLPMLLTSCWFSAVPLQPLQLSHWALSLSPSPPSFTVSHVSPMPLELFFPPPFNFPHLCLLKLLVSITPSWIICSMSLISNLKPGNERLGAVIGSRLVPVWPALSKDHFKGLTEEQETWMKEQKMTFVCHKS